MASPTRKDSHLARIVAFAPPNQTERRFERRGNKQ
uniref:DUF2735 domain-containing protein n=1 Tax=Ascaris lumbricoides TaxID=6252 RepID=A0A0M3ILX6_ASCLU